MENKECKIGIIGSGFSGIYMAYQLKKAGYKQVMLFESSHRYGGKIETIWHKEIPHEMGACYTTPAYAPLYSLMKELAITDTAPVPSRENILEGSLQLIKKEHFSIYVINQAQINYPWLKKMPKIFTKLYIAMQIKKYLRIHKNLFGSYSGTVIPRPTKSILKKIDVTFLEFLKRENLLALIGIFRLFITLQGYGYLEETPAFYGLSWCNQKTMQIVWEQMKSVKSGHAYMIKSGMEKVVNSMVKNENINIKLNSKISSIKLNKGKPTIEIKTSNGGINSLEFDVIFSSLPLPEFSKIVDIPKYKNISFFQQEPGQFDTFLVESSTAPELGTISSWFENTLPYRNGHPVTQRLSKDIILPGTKTQDEKDLRVWLQYSKNKTLKGEVLKKLYPHLKRYYPGSYKIIYHKSVHYFFRWNSEQIRNGAPWELLNLQGEDGIYHIGGSAYFESLIDIMNYNSIVFEKFEKKAN
jgi:Flavin containing amine oxidoreductase